MHNHMASIVKIPTISIPTSVVRIEIIIFNFILMAMTGRPYNTEPCGQDGSRGYTPLMDIAAKQMLC